MENVLEKENFSSSMLLNDSQTFSQFHIEEQIEINVEPFSSLIILTEDDIKESSDFPLIIEENEQVESFEFKIEVEEEEVVSKIEKKEKEREATSRYGVVPPPRRISRAQLTPHTSDLPPIPKCEPKKTPTNIINNNNKNNSQQNSGEGERIIFQSGNEKLDLVLNNLWKFELFQRYLQTLKQETIFQFYVDLQKCKDSWKKEVKMNNDPFFKAKKIGEQAVKIYQMYLSHDSLPSQLRDLLKESAVPFIVTDLGSVDPRSRSNSSNSYTNSNTNSTDDLDSMSGDHSFVFSSDDLTSEDCNEVFDDDDLINNVAESLVNSSPLSNLNNNNYNDFNDFECRGRKKTVTEKIIDGSIFNSVEIKTLHLLLPHLDAFNVEYQNVSNYRPSVCVSSQPNNNNNHQSLLEREMDNADIYFLDSKSNSPSLLQTSSSSSNLIIEYATLDKLVHRLTTPNALSLYGIDFQTSFLLCYRYFTKTEEFIALLKKRIDVILLSNPYEKDNAQYNQWNKTNLLPTVLRITAITKLIVESHIEFFRKETSQKSMIINFVQDEIQKITPMPAKNLIDFINKKIAIREKVTYSEFQFDKKPPKPKIKLGGGKGEFSLSAVYVIELARQMTILDFRLFRSIRVEECLNMNWTRENKEKLSPNVLSSIRQFCNVSLWVAQQIVSRKEIEKRADVLRRMIKLAQSNFDLANFNGAMAVYCGLRNHSVIRLKQTWALLPAAAWDSWEKLESSFKCDLNFIALRNIHQNCPLPSIPYLGLFLSDLTFIDNEPNFHPDKQNLVNFAKMQFIGAIMNQIKKYQTTVYNFEEVEVFQQYLNNLHPPNETELYQMSIARESPKGKILCKSKRRSVHKKRKKA